MVVIPELNLDAAENMARFEKMFRDVVRRVSILYGTPKDIRDIEEVRFRPHGSGHEIIAIWATDNPGKHHLIRGTAYPSREEKGELDFFMSASVWVGKGHTRGTNLSMSQPYFTEGDFLIFVRRFAR